MSRRWWFSALLALILAAAIQFAPWPPGWADAVYLGVTLPFWSALSAPLVGSVAGSLSSLLLIGLLLALSLALLAGAKARRLTARGLVVIAALLALAFPFTFGLGYHTTPLEAHFAPLVSDDAVAADGAADRSTSSAAREVTRQLVLLTLQETQPAAASASATDPPPLVASAAACLGDYLSQLREQPPATIPTRIKAVPAGWLLRIGFAGVISPWLLEPHVDAALPTSNALAVALHELAHTAGVAREAEAEAIGMLAGIDCDDPRVRYAAALNAARSLAYELPSAEREAYLAQWPAQAVAAAATAAAVASEYRSAAATRVAEGVYDAYLSSQGSEGMEDYRRATDLLVLGLAGSRR